MKRFLKTNLFILIILISFVNLSLAIIYPIFTGLILRSDHLFSFQNFSERFLYLGIAMAIFPLMLLIGWFVFYALSKKISIKTLLGFSTLILCLSNFCVGLSIDKNSYLFLVLFRGLAGLFSGQLFPLLLTLANEFHLTKDRAKFFRSLGAINIIAFIFAIGIGGFLSDKTIVSWFSDATPFYILSIMYLGAFSLLALKFSMPDIMKRHIEKDSHQNHFTCTPFWILGNRSILINSLTFFFFILGWFSTIQFLSTDLIVRFHLNNLWVATSLFASAISFLIGNRLASLACDGSKKITLFIIIPLLIICSQTSHFFIFAPVFILTVICMGYTFSYFVKKFTKPFEDKVLSQLLSTKQLIMLTAIILSPIFVTLTHANDVTNIYLSNSISTILAFFFLSFEKSKKII